MELNAKEFKDSDIFVPIIQGQDGKYWSPNEARFFKNRKSTFEPQIVKKRQKDISDIDQKIISMYAKGMMTRQISETIEDIYGFETSEGFISDVTDKILPQIEDWQNRPLDEVYPILYMMRRTF